MKKTIGVLFAFIFLLSLFFTIYLGYQKYLIGDAGEREKVIVETTWELSKQGYRKEDIKDIYVLYSANAGGTRPYKVHVVFSNEPDTSYLYTWQDADYKNGVIEIGESAPRR